MPISYNCPHCDAIIETDETQIGRPTPCAQCGKESMVPGATVQAGRVGQRKRPSLVVWLILGTFCGTFLFCCGGLIICIPSNREPARRAACRNHLKNVALAMHTYHTMHGSFPPAYIPDENGKPMHSWRVLLLPFVEEEALYKQYNFNEPWDGPNNIRVVKKYNSIYRCPSEVNSPNMPTTSYVMIVGPGTISDGPTATKIEDIADGTDQTLLLVEMSDSGIPWAKPRDLDAKMLAFGVNPAGAVGIRGAHGKVVNVVYCDGHTGKLDDTVSPKTLRALSTIAGGEDVSEFFRP